MQLVLGILILLGAFFSGKAITNIDVGNPSVVATILPTSTPTAIPSTPTPTIKAKPKIVVDSDPIVNCNISPNCGGGTKPMKLNACKQSSCCQLDSGWKLYSNRESCIIAQNNEKPPCNIYYTYLGYSKTYNLTPSDCSYYQQRASDRTEQFNLPTYKIDPPPSIAPYQPSQEYLDSLNNINNVVNATWAPTQVVLPTPRCYATWDQYFNAHPEIVGSNVSINNGTPPCD